MRYKNPFPPFIDFTILIIFTLVIGIASVLSMHMQLYAEAKYSGYMYVITLIMCENYNPYVFASIRLDCVQSNLNHLCSFTVQHENFQSCNVSVQIETGKYSVSCVCLNSVYQQMWFSF